MKLEAKQLRANMPKVMILLSGGLDSAACTAFFNQKNYHIEALHFDYGQPAAKNELKAARAVSRHYKIKLHSVYLNAKQAVLNAGFQKEIDWQSNVQFEQTEESDFLREAAWVVLSSGFRESVIRRIFPRITAAFLGWESARSIINNKQWCRAKALSVFANERKINSVIRIAEEVAKIGYLSLKARIKSSGVGFLQTLPYIGPVTSFHLAKNIGLNVSKPDRHLVRAARSAGVFCPQKMCQMIHQVVGDSVAVVDIVIWRYATINPKYPSEFSLSTNLIKQKLLRG